MVYMYTWHMPRVSKYTLPLREVEQLSQHFSSLIASLHKETQIEKFLDEFLTREEKNMLAKRLALFIMLKQNEPASAIKATLHFSRETVRIYQQQFITKSNEFHATLSHLLRMEKVKEFFMQSGQVLHTLVTAKTNMQSRSKILSGKWR